MVLNQYSWDKIYKILFVDQPVEAWLSYADTNSSKPYVTSMNDIFIDY